MTPRQAKKLTPPPWGETTRHETAVLPDGRFLIAGERVRVDGRRGVWTFVRRCVTAAGSEWLDVVGPDGPAVPVSPDKVHPTKKATR